MKYTNDLELKICKLFEDGLSPTEIAKQFQTYNTTIRRILLRNNYMLKGPSETQKVVKTNPFENLKNPTIQYWLGFLMADGNLSDPKNSKYTIDISAAEIDKKHLCKYAKFIGYNIKPRKYLNKKFNSYMYSVRFGNKEVHTYLTTLGITPNKSKTLKLKIELTWDIIRGILDGDGYIRQLSNNRNQIEIVTGSKQFYKQLKTFFNKNKIKVTGQFKTYLGVLRICTQKEIIKFVSHVYINADVFLQRKYNKLGPSIKKFIEEHTTNSGKP